MASDPARNPATRLLALAAASVAVLLAGAWIPAWSRDEAATAMVVRRPFDQLLRIVSHDPALQPYYLAMHAWSVVSTSELWLRLPSVLAAVGAVVLLVRIAERFFSPPAALLAGLCLLLLPATTRFGTDARPYALSLLLTCGVVSIWLQDRQLSRWPRQLALIVVLAALGLFQAYALLIVVVLLSVAALRPEVSRRREVSVLLRCVLLAGLALAPVLWAVATGAEGAPNRPDLTVANVAVEILRGPVGILGPVAAPVVAMVALGAAAAGLILGWRAGGPARTGALLATLWLLLPPVLLCLLQATTSAPGLLARYWTFGLPAFGLAVAGFDRGRAGRAVTVAVVGLIGLLGLPTQLALRGPDGHAGRGWRELPVVLQRDELAAGAVLVEGPHYRVLVANHPALTMRMPLVIDPGPTGRILPRIAGRSTEEFRNLTNEFGTVVVLQNLPRPSPEQPTRRSFDDHRRELEAFDRPAVLCSYFGYPLGVFTTSTARLDAAQTRRIADTLAAVDPAEVTCAAR